MSISRSIELRLDLGQGGQAADPGAPRPVTTGRRLLGVMCDLLGFWLAGGVVAALLNALSLALAGEWLSASRSGGLATGTTWAVWAALFVVLPMLGRGGTLGQRAVLLHPVLPDGHRPSRGRLLARSLAGTGGFVLLHNLGEGGATLGLLWGLICLVGVIRTRDHRGIAGVWTGTVLRDRRLETYRAPESPARPDQSLPPVIFRRLGWYSS